MLGTWATQIPLVKERLGVDTATLGLALLCSALGGIAGMPFAARLTRAWGEVAVLRATVLLACLMLPAAAAATDIWLLALALLLFGAGFGLVDLVMNAQAVQVEREVGRPIMSGLHGMWSLGALCGAGLGSLLLALLPALWQAGLLSGLGALLMLAVAGAMLPMQPAADQPPQVRIPGLARRPALLRIGAMMAVAFAVEGALLDWSAIFLRETRHLPASEAGLGYAGFAASMLCGRLTGDRARARWGDRRVLQGTMLGAAFLLGAVLAPSPWLAIAGFTATGLTLCNVAPILFNAAGWLGEAAAPGGSTQAVATAVGFGYAGVMMAPPMFGLVARQSSLSVALCVAAACCLLLGLGARVAAQASALDPSCAGRDRVKGSGVVTRRRAAHDDPSGSRAEPWP